MPVHRPSCDRKRGESSLYRDELTLHGAHQPHHRQHIRGIHTRSQFVSCIACRPPLLYSTPHRASHYNPSWIWHTPWSVCLCTFCHLKLSVLLGMVHSDLSSHLFCFTQTHSQASRATSGRSPTATSPTSTATSTPPYSATMAIAIDKRSVSDARADSRLSSAAKINIFGATAEEI